MTIQYCSDLHLEFQENSRWVKSRPLVPVAETLILAGDIVPLKSVKEFDWFFDWISDHFKMTYWIPGNHEYYGFIITESDLSFSQNVRDNNFNYFHLVSLDFLEGSFGSHVGANNIVVTHHVPTFNNYPPEFLYSSINQAFTTELKDHIKRLSPKYWIYGHHHRNVPSFKVYETTFLTNQLGYVNYGENKGFNGGALLELGS